MTQPPTGKKPPPPPARRRSPTSSRPRKPRTTASARAASPANDGKSKANEPEVIVAPPVTPDAPTVAPAPTVTPPKPTGKPPGAGSLLQRISALKPGASNAHKPGAPDNTAAAFDEKRVHPRFELLAQVQLTRFTEVHIMPATNISRGGMFLLGNPLEYPELVVGSNVELLVFSDELGVPDLRGRGKIVRAEPATMPSGGGFGVLFVSLPPPGPKHLEDLILRLSIKLPPRESRMTTEVDPLNIVGEEDVALTPASQPETPVPAPAPAPPAAAPKKQPPPPPARRPR